MTPEIYHIPALLEDSINGLNIKPDGIYADVTFGGGGHSRAILGKLGDNGHLFGFDRDSDALKTLRMTHDLHLYIQTSGTSQISCDTMGSGALTAYSQTSVSRSTISMMPEEVSPSAPMLLLTCA